MSGFNEYVTWNIQDEVKLRVTESGNASFAPKTVVDGFKNTLAKCGSSHALHVKRNNEWQSMTYQEYYDQCKAFGKSLLHLGMDRFQGVGIIGFNSPEWVIADVGAIFAGGVAAGIYTTNTPQACEYIADHSNAVAVVCDGANQLEKFVSVHKNLPKLKALVIYNEPVPEGLDCSVPVYSWDDFLQLGAKDEDEAIDKAMEDQRPGQCCTLIYTSGTTGQPKGVMVSHDNIMWTIETVAREIARNHDLVVDNRHRLVSYLPMSHIAAQLIDIHLPVTHGVQMYFAQPDALKGSLAHTMKEVRPTLFFGVPRVWEKIMEKMKLIGAQTTGIKKRLATWAREKGMQKSQMAQFGQSGGAPCGYGIANALVLTRIKEALGLDQCQASFSGAAPISDEVVNFFAALDLPIYEFFGQSEVTGPQTCDMKGWWKIGSCGVTIAGSEIKCAEDTGELLFRGRNIMMGYLNNEEQTRDTIDEEGWLHSGDIGDIDQDGFMKITGRIKELIVTAGGENVPPVLIEDAFKEELPLLSNVMVIGDKRKFLSALFTLRSTVDEEGHPTDELDETAMSIMKEIGSSSKTVSEAKDDDKVKKYLDDGLKRANAKAASRAQNVGKYTILDKDFSIAGGEMTPTLKLKRPVVLDKYSETIEAMYDV